MPAERVVIDIEVNSDIATIEATRQALERLTNAQKRYNRERDRGGSGGDDDSGGGGGGGGGGNGRRRPRGGGGGGGGKGRYDGFGGKVFDFRGDMGKAIASYGTLLKLVNKMAMVSLPLMMGALSGIALAFQAGTYFIKMYKAAMSTLASAVGIAFVGITTLLAAQKEFAVVQNSPAYMDGANNTSDRMIAAGQAMSMFTDNTRLAVIGSKGLSASFTTLSKIKPVTGETTAAFTTLMDVVAGSGGDLEKGSQKLADFLAAVQKKGSLAGGASAAKELGPDFEKIVKEAGALGIKTSDEFLKAAAEGKLGETFATKYKGTLDALNNTVMGRFKSAVTSIKGLLTDLGGQYLDEAGTGISRLQGIISKLIVRLNYVLKEFDVSGKMGGFLDAVDKGADKLIVLMTRYLNTTPTIFQFFEKSFMTIGNAFDRMQDWMRQFQVAGELINKYFFGPLFSALGTSFTTSMTSLSETIEKNKGTIESFALQIAKTLTAIGKYGDVVRKLFIGAMPVFNLILKMVEMFFTGLAKFGKAAIAIGDKFEKVFGKVGGGAVKLAALYALFAIATRFFTILGTMFGKNMKNTGTMNVRAGVVNVGGATGTPGVTTPVTPGTGRFDGKFMKTRAAFGKMGSLGFGNLAMIGGGGALMAAGSAAGGDETAKGSAMKTAGMTMTGLGLASMMLGDSKGKAMPNIKKGSALSKMGMKSGSTVGGAVMAPLAIGALSYGAGSYIGGKFNDDSVQSRGMSAGASALAGAGIGAAIGSFVPIIGTGIGAAIGAAIGGITGYMKAGKQRKQTRKAASELVESYGDTVSEAIAGGNVDDLLKARDDAMRAKKELINNNADPAYAAKAVAKYDEEFKKLSVSIDNYTGNTALAEQAFGTSAETLNKLAEAAGVDLTKKLYNFRDVLDLVGKTAEEKARMVKVAFASIGQLAVSETMSYFDKKKQAVEQSKLLNTTQSKILSGDSSTATADEYLKNVVDYNVGQFGDVGGITNSFLGLEEQLTTGSLKGISDTEKAYMRAEAGKAGISSEGLLKNISSSDLAMLVGGNSALAGISDKNGIVDPKKFDSLLKTEMKQNPEFLANFLTAQQSSNRLLAGEATGGVLANGTAGSLSDVSSMEGMSPIALRARGFSGTGVYTPPAATSPGPAYVNTTINASVLDRGTIVQIEAAIAKALRERSERGGLPLGVKNS